MPGDSSAERREFPMNYESLPRTLRGLVINLTPHRQTGATAKSLQACAFLLRCHNVASTHRTPTACIRPAYVRVPVSRRRTSVWPHETPSPPARTIPQSRAVSGRGRPTWPFLASRRTRPTHGRRQPATRPPAPSPQTSPPARTVPRSRAVSCMWPVGRVSAWYGGPPLHPIYREYGRHLHQAPGGRPLQETPGRPKRNPPTRLHGRPTFNRVGEMSRYMKPP